MNSTLSTRLAVTPSHNIGMRTKHHLPLRAIFVEYVDKETGVWMHLLSCGHRLTADDKRRPFSRRCPYCPRRV